MAPNVTTLRGSDLGGTEKLKIGSTVPSRRVGFSKRGDLKFPSYKNTTFIMNVTLFYTPDPKTGLFGDIIFAEFFQACGLAKTPKRKLNIDYSIGIAIPFFMALGYKPSFSGESGIECPFEQGEMDRIISQLSNPSGAGDPDASAPPS